jgi:hypothetical protein
MLAAAAAAAATTDNDVVVDFMAPLTVLRPLLQALRPRPPALPVRQRLPMPPPRPLLAWLLSEPTPLSVLSMSTDRVWVHRMRTLNLGLWLGRRHCRDSDFSFLALIGQSCVSTGRAEVSPRPKEINSAQYQSCLWLNEGAILNTMDYIISLVQIRLAVYRVSLHTFLQTSLFLSFTYIPILLFHFMSLASMNSTLTRNSSMLFKVYNSFYT